MRRARRAGSDDFSAEEWGRHATRLFELLLACDKAAAWRTDLCAALVDQLALYDGNSALRAACFKLVGCCLQGMAASDVLQVGYPCAASAPELGSPLRHPLRDRVHPATSGIGTGLTPATSVPGLGFGIVRCKLAGTAHRHTAAALWHHMKWQRRLRPVCSECPSGT
jgi:hypothetical protein